MRASRFSLYIQLMLPAFLAACAAPAPAPLALTQAAKEEAAIRQAEAALPASERQEAAEAARIDPQARLVPASEDELAPYRAALTQAEKLLGFKHAYRNETELTAYLTTYVKAKPVGEYDREGFLAELGLTSPRAGGRTDGPTFAAVLAIPGLTPGADHGGHERPAQALAMRFAVANPKLYAGLAVVVNPGLEAPSRLKGKWRKAFSPLQAPAPTGQSAPERYAGAYAMFKRYGLAFDDDVHSGLPGTAPDGTLEYGTSGMLRQLGFTEEVLTRIARTTNAVDEPDATPYGRTHPLVFGQMDRHFNLDRRGQDTRLLWAKRHLDAAVGYARQTAYAEAEVELGCGLHSLQDSFAHGQLSPYLHGTIGHFPDDVHYNPLAYLEAASATQAYMRRYLERLR